jgi:hypothetical protein
MRRILRKVASGEYDQLGDISTLADPAVSVLKKNISPSLFCESYFVIKTQVVPKLVEHFKTVKKGW